MSSGADVITTWLRSDQPAVIFDFNGTLSDDEPILFDIFSELFRVHLDWAMTAEDYRDELLGRSDREIIERAVARHGHGTEQEVTELLRLRHGVYRQRVADSNPIADTTVRLVKLLADNEIPLGTYIYDSARGQAPIYLLGMLSYFETKNIGKKTQRAKAFAEFNDQVSQHDMEFDWADEIIHANYGTRWIGALREAEPDAVPDFNELRDQCNELVDAIIATATDQERTEIRQVAQAMIQKAESFASS